MLLVALLFVSQTVAPLPDPAGWQVVLQKQLEFRVNDCQTAFVGLMTEYRNPQNTGEFIRVYRQQIALVSRCAKDLNTGAVRDPEGTVSVFNYRQKKERDALNLVQKATDVFAIVRWKTAEDSRSGQTMLDGPIQSWLLDQAGSWMFSNGQEMVIMPFSEPFIPDTTRRVSVGLQFSLGDATRVVRIDQEYLVTPKGKDKEKGNGK